jgi:16S rRNA (adenine1518-N6/adenine1519-N6)-dimethyltransferase
MSIRHTLERLGVEPKKSLGQNFMVQPAVLERMADAANLSPADTVLEVGAGLGALTEALAGRARRVVALEIDGRFIPALEERFADRPHVEIVRADALEADLAALLGEDAADYKVVANLPYYVTTAILRCLLESDVPPRLLVLTMQREVAERIAARPGAMSLLAVSVQVYGAARVVSRLKPGVFYPRPGVESAIVRIDPHPEPPLKPDERGRFFRIVRAGFGQPRKQIKNSLAAGLRVDGERVVDWLQTTGIDPRRRAETLSVGEWLALLRAAANGLGNRVE